MSGQNPTENKNPTKTSNDAGIGGVGIGAVTGVKGSEDWHRRGRPPGQGDIKPNETAKRTDLIGDPSQTIPLNQWLQAASVKWMPAPGGLVSGDPSETKTLGEWLGDPRLEPYLNNNFYINGPLGSDSYYSGYTLLESTDVINDGYWKVLLMTPNPS